MTTNPNNNEAPDLNWIDPLHPTTLQSYKGRITRSYDYVGGFVVLEFDTYHQATSWARTCEIEDRTKINSTNTHLWLAQTVIISYYPPREANNQC